MMGPHQAVQTALFYEFNIEEHVPSTHMLRAVYRFVDLSGTRRTYLNTSCLVPAFDGLD